MKNILFIICLFSFFSYAQIPSNIPEEGLIGYWPLDGDANDYSGNENHGAVYGATATSDRFGNPNSAYNFSVDGSGGWGAAQHRIVVSNPSIPNDNSFTMSAWVNLETKPSPFNNRPHTIMGRWDSNGARVFRYKIIYNGDVITQLFSGSTNYSHSSGNVSYGNWAHVVSTYDGTILKHYINGVLSGQETLSITINSSSTNLTFGEMHMSNGHWYLFSGKMDDLGYWSRALNSEEITSIFNSNPCQETSISASATEVCAGDSVDLTATSALAAGSTACTSADLPANLQNGLVGYWPFCGNANDESGNGNNGTVTGPTLTSDRLGNSNNAYSFDGSLDEYIVLSSNNIPSSGDFSVAFWINMQSYYLQESDNVEFINLGSQDDTKWGIASNISGDARMNYGKGCNDSGGNSISEVFNLNNWDHFIFVTNNINTQIFKNGVLVGTTENGTSSDCSTTNLYFGTDIFSNQENTEMILDNVAIWDRALTTNEIQQISNDSTFSWSTGDTTQNISVTPTETTDYWVDATTNGVTCREYITISVTAPAAPTGDAEQTFCEASTVAGLTATGDTIQWYDASIGVNLLDATTALADGQVVYASQTINGCESTDRLEVRVSIQDINITASETEVCAGDSVDLTATSALAAGSTACTSADLTANLQNGLVGYWPFCGNANDESDNGNNGTVNGATLTIDRFGNPDSAYSFDGISSDLLNSNQFISLGNDYTISMWFNSSNVNQGNQGLFNTIGHTGIDLTLNHNYNSNAISLFIGDGLNFWDINGTGGIKSDYNSNQWYHIVLIKNGINYKLYVDNVLDININVGSSVNYTNLVGFRIGQIGGNNELFNGSLDDVAIWDSVLIVSEVQQLANSSTYAWSTGDTTANISVTPTETTEYWVDVSTNGVTCREYVTINVTAPAAPTGDTEQTFCEASTVAGLTATGDTIQWYDASIGGNLLDATTALADGQVVFASQIINSCESNDRLEVTVSIITIEINASETEVCAGESVDLSTIGDINSSYMWSTGFESGSTTEQTLIGEFTHTVTTFGEQSFDIIPGNQYVIEVSGIVSIPDTYDVAYYTDGSPRAPTCDDSVNISLFCESPTLRPTPDVYDSANHTYFYPFTATSNSVYFGFRDNVNYGDNSGTITFKLYEISSPLSSMITVTPFETTEYWVDVTTNGVTCREYITINVNDLPDAPTGEAENYFIYCDTFSPTLESVISTLTGDNIQFYDSEDGGDLLNVSSLIYDGQIVYASQSVGLCESSERFEVILNLYVLDNPFTDAPNNTVSFCNLENLTILNLAPAQTATSRLWYETEFSTTPIPETTLLVDGASYYVTNYDPISGCESDRLAMSVLLNTPAAPAGDSVQSFCDVSTVADLTVTGDTIQWYDSATGGILLDDTTVLIDGQLVYASQTENDCESLDRLGVSVEIDIITDPILITTELDFCLAREATLADLEIDAQGFELEWYDSYTGGTLLGLDTILEDAISYYATLYDVVSGCESLMRLEVIPTVIPCEVIIYNAISINYNGLNDYMVIENAEYFPFNTLEIFNRDGYLVYNQRKYGVGDNLFRGMANVGGIYSQGSNLPTGSYLYVFTYYNPYEQQEFVKKGFLTINNN